MSLIRLIRPNEANKANEPNKANIQEKKKSSVLIILN